MIRRAAICLMFCAAAAASAAEIDAPTSDVAVRELWFEHSERGYALRARLSAGSEELIRALLESGYVVRFGFEMRFMRARDWLPDRDLGEIKWSPEILYDSLLGRYAFSAGGAAEEYGELSAAVARAGRLRAAPQNSARLDDMFRMPGVYLVARYEMLIDHLPQPLQVSLLTGSRGIDSGWRRFEVQVRE